MKLQSEKNEHPLFGAMKIINTDPVQSAFERMMTRNTIEHVDAKDFEIEYLDTYPIEGYTPPDNFPNCCTFHKSLAEVSKRYYEKFPECCDGHKPLKAASWFNKENYTYLPTKIVNTIVYTADCIDRCIENPNWYKEIIDYIEYTKYSFGQLPAGHGAPVGIGPYIDNIKEYLTSLASSHQARCQQVIAYLDSLSAPTKDATDMADLNILFEKYKQWLKIFPFDLPLFAHLKPYFENQLPFLKGPLETNMYTNTATSRIVTKAELIVFLRSITLEIIKQVDTSDYYQHATEEQLHKSQIGLLSARRKIEIDELDTNGWTDRKQYIKVLKKWLKDETVFLKELKILVNDNFTSALFIKNIVDAFRVLQQHDCNEPCIMAVRQNLPNKETLFRYFFKTFLSGRYPKCILSAEEEKGKGRIDLKVSNSPIESKIIEFKGWWNQKKEKVINQICSYLTDFEHEGYIIMINDRNEDISEKYKQMITDSQTSYCEDSWKEHKMFDSNYPYYETSHNLLRQRKKLYHFIFNVHF